MLSEGKIGFVNEGLQENLKISIRKFYESTGPRTMRRSFAKVALEKLQADPLLISRVADYGVINIISLELLHVEKYTYIFTFNKSNFRNCALCLNFFKRHKQTTGYATKKLLFLKKNLFQITDKCRFWLNKI